MSDTEKCPKCGEQSKAVAMGRDECLTCLLAPDLDPCPFCGSEAYLELCEEECCGAQPFMVVCTKDECGAEMGVTGLSDDEAADAWNNRIRTIREKV